MDDLGLANSQFILWMLFFRRRLRHRHDEWKYIKTRVQHEIQKQKHWNWITHNYRSSPETSYKINDNTPRRTTLSANKKMNLIHYTIQQLKYDQKKTINHQRKMFRKLVELLLLCCCRLDQATWFAIALLHYFACHSFFVGCLVGFFLRYFCVIGHEWWWILYVVSEHKHPLTMKWKSYAIITL